MSTEPITFATVFAELSKGPARPTTVRAAFEAILAGAWSPAQIAGLLVTLRMRGETASDITAAAFAMRGAMIAVDHGLEATLDTCGTGGDGLGTLNVSTAAAIVVASRADPFDSSAKTVANVIGSVLMPPSCRASRANCRAATSLPR